VKRPNQRGPQTSTYSRRYGSDEMPAPGGVNTEVHPAAIPPWQFRQLVNVDWDGMDIVPRGGQLKANTGGDIIDNDAWVHPVSFINASPLRAWILGDGCPGESLGSGFYLGHFDPEQDPAIQRSVWYDTAVQGIAMASYGGVPHVVVDLELRKISQLQVPWGTETIALAGSAHDTPLVTLPAKCNCMIEAFGLLFLLLNNNTIYTWDGITLRLESTETHPPVAACLWRDEYLVIGFSDPAANKLRLRRYEGTYSTVTPGAGTIVVRAGRNSMVAHADEVWTVGDNTDIWNYDGTTLAVARTVASATIQTLARAFNALYYGYTLDNSSDPVTAWIGKTVNGSAWSDSHKNLTAQLAGASAVRGLAYFKESLAAAVLVTSQTTRLMLSPGEDTDLTYEVQSQAGALSNDVRYLVVM